VGRARNFSTSPARQAVFIGPRHRLRQSQIGAQTGGSRAREAVFAGEHRALGAHDGQRHVYR
jgi:hypothetical protein